MGGPRTLVRMRPQRQVVDYSLRRRALLRDLHGGRVGTHEVCDASVCRRENLTHVHYVYGDELKQSAGQARSRAELAQLAQTVREFQVYVVEVCRGCGWNHLIEQYVLGRSGQTTASPVLDLTRDTSSGSPRSKGVTG
jgi:hypothetical protein